MDCALDRILPLIQAPKMNDPSGQKVHFRHLLYFDVRRGQRAAEAAWNICAVYGESATAERTARKWFDKFQSGTLDVTDAPRSRDRPSAMKTVSRHL